MYTFSNRFQTMHTTTINGVIRVTKICFAINWVFTDTRSFTDTTFDSSSGGREYKTKFYNFDISIKTLFVFCPIDVRQSELVLFFTILDRSCLEKKSNTFWNFTAKRYACFVSIDTGRGSRKIVRPPGSTLWRFASSVLHKNKKKIIPNTIPARGSGMNDEARRPSDNTKSIRLL